MSPRLRLALFATLGVVLALMIGVDLANESYGLATLVALACAWLVATRVGCAFPDAWILAAVLLGYVVGNRGFAQLQPSKQIPLLPAEGALLVLVPALVARMALKRVAAVRKDALNYAILAWMLVGTLRLPQDMSRFGVTALRDYATIYYAAFFFIAQAFGGHASSEKLLRRTLTVAFLGLLPVVVSIQASPDFLIDNLTWQGIPIIYHKSDLIATSLAAGFFWLWTRMAGGARRFWFVAASASLLLIGLMASPRAGMFGVFVVTALWLATGRWRIAAAELGVVAAASVVSVAALAFLGRDLTTSAPYSMYEHAVSIFDPAGSGTYINGESGDPGANNRFRMIWWRDVIEDTLSTNPVLGTGFGSDLSTRFLADYDLLTDETFAARSPHSMIVTMFGRLGLVGLLAWVAISAALARMVWRLFKSGDPDGLGLASVVCVIWLSACVGVVLESPMGAVVFWTTAGLANARALGLGPRQPPPRASADESPVAMSAPLLPHSSPR